MWSSMNKKSIYVLRTIILLVILLIFIKLIMLYLHNNIMYINENVLDISDESFRVLDINVECEKIKETAQKLNVPAGDMVAAVMSVNNMHLDKESLDNMTKRDYVRIRNKLRRISSAGFNEAGRIYDGLINDIIYFPIPVSTLDFPWVNYVDSWGYDRIYGGARHHEGTDIMADKNIAGVYPVVSICDGTVTNVGWLELGGYRIGITSDNGIYYYYAHLSSYAQNITEGSHIKAGELIGFMGNTGYSKVEGTSGRFDVHLHFGIYITGADGSEIALNPYNLLKNSENKVLYYKYKV